MMILEDMTIGEQAKLIATSLEANQDKLGDVLTNFFMRYQTESSKFIKENMGKMDDAEVSKQLQEMLARIMAQGQIEAFKLGYISGMNVAFDIVEAKAMEMSGGTCSVVN